ncbi:MAG: hypothetical protein AB1730_16220 [Myxococcota bacterium]
MRLSWILVLVLTSPAFAAKRPVLVNAPARVAKVLNRELGKKYTPVPLKGSLGPSPTAKEVRDVTAPARAIAVIQAQAGGKYVTLQVLSGHDGTPLDTITFKPPKKFKALPPDAAKALFAALAQGKPPAAEPKADTPVVDAGGKSDARAPEEKKAAPGEQPVSEQAVAAGSASASSSSSAEAEPAAAVSSRSAFEPTPSELPAIVTGVGFKGFGRSFGWAAGSSDALASYALPFAGAVAFEGAWYPGAHFTAGFGGNLGAFLNGEVGIGLASRQDESRYGTRADRFRFGATVRFPLGERVLLDALLGYSTQTFAIAEQSATTGNPRPNIPSVTYNGPRAAVGTHFRITDWFGADALFGFMYVYGKGELASNRYFPNTTGLALDGGVGLSLRLVETLRVRASFDWTGYFLSTHADPMAVITSTGASDHFVGGTLSLLWVM